MPAPGPAGVVLSVRRMEAPPVSRRTRPTCRRWGRAASELRGAAVESHAVRFAAVALALMLLLLVQRHRSSGSSNSMVPNRGREVVPCMLRVEPDTTLSHVRVRYTVVDIFLSGR